MIDSAILAAGEWPEVSELSVSSLIGLSCAVAYLLVRIALSLAAIRYVRLHPESIDNASARVDVLMPILSGDPDLESALLDNLQGTDPTVQFVWLVDRDDHEGLRLTQDLAASYPERVHLVMTEPFTGQGNPKVAKLIVGLEHVSADYVAVLDDDTRLGTGQIPAAVAALQQGADLYTGLPSYTAAPGFFSHAVAQFVNSAAIHTYLSPLAFLSPVTINGMFYVGRSKWFRETEAWSVIQPELCDDYALAKFAIGHHAKIHQGHSSQRIRTTVRGAQHYFRLMHRWLLFAGILLNDQPLSRRLVLLTMLGLPVALLWGSLIALLEPSLGFAIVAVTAALRWMILMGARRWIGLPALWIDPVTSLGVELLQPLHALHAELFRTIRWRTRRFRVRRSGEFVSVSG